jgi:cytochrome c551/c552
VKASAEGSVDPDKDALIYVWHFGSTVQKASSSPNANFTFTKAGDYSIYVEVKDAKGAVTKSEVMKVYAGNEAPNVTVKNVNNNNFYFPGVPVPYEVLINDKEDGTIEKGNVDKKSIFVKVDYISGMDRAQVVGHQIITAAMEGKNLAATLDCKVCHKENEKSIGPSYKQVAQRYQQDPKAKTYLTNKIIKGGGGVWGETAMAAHPDLKPSDAEMIVEWILGLNKPVAPSLPANGTIVPTAKDLGNGNLMQITATYTDKGGKGLRPQSGVGNLILRSPVINMDANNRTDKVTIAEFGGKKIAVSTDNVGLVYFNQLNLYNVKAVELNYMMQAVPDIGYIISFHVDGANGKQLGSVKIGHDADMKSTKVAIPLQGVPDQPFNLVMKISKADPKESQYVGISALQLIAK